MALPSQSGLRAGDRVQVRNHFDGSWSPGFAIADQVVKEGTVVGYRLRRMSDGAAVPGWFSVFEVIRDDRAMHPSSGSLAHG